MQLEIITAPQYEPVTLAQAKLAARVTESDEDTFFTDILIPAARQDCEQLLRRFPLEAGVSPGFAVLEEGEARLVAERAREAVALHVIREPDGEIGREGKGRSSKRALRHPSRRAVALAVAGFVVLAVTNLARAQTGHDRYWMLAAYALAVGLFVASGLSDRDRDR